MLILGLEQLVCFLHLGLSDRVHFALSLAMGLAELSKHSWGLVLELGNQLIFILGFFHLCLSMSKELSLSLCTRGFSWLSLFRVSSSIFRLRKSKDSFSQINVDFNLTVILDRCIRLICLVLFFFVSFTLSAHQFRIDANWLTWSLDKQRLVGALLSDRSLLHDDNMVSVLDG